MAEDEEIGPGGCLAVLGVVDLPVRPVHADPEHLHAHAASAGNLGHVRSLELGEVCAARFPGVNRDGLHDALLFDSAAGISAAGISWLCCSSLATSPVQPVWWDAPTPEPSSPWKYSWKGIRSRKCGSALSVGWPPKTGLRPCPSRRKIRDKRREMSAATSASVACFPERAGYSTVNESPR